MKTTKIVKYGCTLLMMLSVNNTLVYAAETRAKAKAKIKAPDWVITAAPQAGWIQNKTTFTFKIPDITEPTGESHQTLTMTDKGWGSGFAGVLLYKWLVWTNVLFYFTDINSSNVLGGITHVSTSIPTGYFFKPYLGLGLFFMNTKTRFRNFEDSKEGQLSSGELTTGYASFSRISVDNRILTPLPEIGLKFKIPIQNWWVTPYYSYWHENVATHVNSPGGQLNLYERGTQNHLKTIELKAFDKKINKSHNSHLIGTWFNIDFHHFLQLQGNVYYNMTHDLLSARFVGTVLFSEYVGLTAYFEYQELIPVDNIYFFIGPCFVLLPPGFFDSVMALRYAS